MLKSTEIIDLETTLGFTLKELIINKKGEIKPTKKSCLTQFGCIWKNEIQDILPLKTLQNLEKLHLGSNQNTRNTFIFF
ncbi:MAG: hypothetical protein MUC49_04760 [Raineya sp.]|jgi:Leucine-rich repeat (LRR) protein|nr:hypothetical protein [Raineya sp.]